ncbi:Zn-dependent alcohol dehydrogenase [Tomitella biformata]|uniref:Zn-dependent alcohol dehydrogenase n=1 Tax=Tomitella biformata TaxID=630403 RepID=UPI00046604FC|nr:Zn-dependent alcohol dehydrogenase [Tomitella biformata]
MKAAVLRNTPGKVTIEDVSIDKPQQREVLIRTSAAGVCHSDLHYAEGHFPTRLPTVLGHESAGIVEEVGPGVTHVKPGDHVVSCLSVYCGTCEYCLSGRLVLCRKRGLRRGRGGPQRLSDGDGGAMWQFLDLSSFGEQMLVHENALAVVNPEMPLDRASLLGCAVTTGLGAVFHTAAVSPGESVAIIGCGGVGLNAVQGASIAGAARIIAVDPIPSKREMALLFGATDVVDPADGDPVAQIQELTGGGVDHAIEAIGLKPTTEQAFAMLRIGGTATIVGMIPMGVKIEVPGIDFMSEKRIQGSLMGSNRFQVDIPRYVDLYLKGRLKLDELVSGTIRLDQINDAFDQIRRGEVARNVVVFD